MVETAGEQQAPAAAGHLVPPQGRLDLRDADGRELDGALGPDGGRGDGEQTGGELDLGLVVGGLGHELLVDEDDVAFVLPAHGVVVRPETQPRHDAGVVVGDLHGTAQVARREGQDARRLVLGQR